MAGIKQHRTQLAGGSARQKAAGSTGVAACRPSAGASLQRGRTQKVPQELRMIQYLQAVQDGVA